MEHVNTPELCPGKKTPLCTNVFVPNMSTTCELLQLMQLSSALYLHSSSYVYFHLKTEDVAEVLCMLNILIKAPVSPHWCTLTETKGDIRSRVRYQGKSLLKAPWPSSLRCLRSEMGRGRMSPSRRWTSTMTGSSPRLRWKHYDSHFTLLRKYVQTLV